MNNYYIYIYLDPRKSGKYKYEEYEFGYEPFYIGKGKDNRWKELGENKRNKYFIRKINKIRKSKLEPITIKLYENLNEEKSFEIEKQLIYNIEKINPGILVNLTKGGEGTSGYKHTEKTKKSISEKNRKNFQDVKKEFKKRKYILLTEENEYKSARTTKLKYICPSGHEGSMSWDNFQKRQNCATCKSEKQKGEKNHNSVLIVQDVIQIKLLLKEEKLFLQKISEIFGVSKSTIADIKYGRTWFNILNQIGVIK